MDCVQCGFCLPTCASFLLTGEELDSPRGRVRLLEAWLDRGAAGAGDLFAHTDSCLGCLACLTVCPHRVGWVDLVEAAKAHTELEGSRPAGERLLRRLALGTFPHPRRARLLFALGRLGVRPLPARLRRVAEVAPPWSAPRRVRDLPAEGERVLRVGLLEGCVQRVLFGDVNEAAARVLAADGCDVAVPRGQGCCGALHLHTGRVEEGLAFARRTIDAFEQAGVHRVVVAAAGCGSSMKRYGHLLAGDPAYAARAETFSATVKDVTELLAEIGPQAERTPLPVRVALQDACHLAHAQRVRDQPRQLLLGIPGLVLAEPAEQAVCCGSAGIFNVVRPEEARALGDRKAGLVLAIDPDVYASANPGCLVQVSAALRRAGRPLPALHPVELVDASIRGLGSAAVVAAARR